MLSSSDGALSAAVPDPDLWAAAKAQVRALQGWGAAGVRRCLVDWFVMVR